MENFFRTFFYFYVFYSLNNVKRDYDDDVKLTKEKHNDKTVEQQRRMTTSEGEKDVKCSI